MKVVMDEESMMRISEPKVSGFWHQVFAAFVVTLGAFTTGNCLAWSSPSLPHIDEGICGDDCDIEGISSDQSKWIGPAFTLGAATMGPFVGPLVNRLGRKRVMLWLSVPMVAGWILIVFSPYLNRFNVLIISRVLSGIGAGAFAYIAPTYIAETAQTSLRGALASLLQLQSNFGVAFVDVFAINGAVRWNVISGICLAIPVLMVMGLLFLPETPFHLIKKGQVSTAKKSLRWFRGGRITDEELEEEFMMIRKQTDQSLLPRTITLKQMLTQTVYLKPFLLGLGLMFFQQFCGINVMVFNAQTIFDKVGSDMDSGLSAFLSVALCQVLGTGLAVLIVERFGRKFLLIISHVVMAVSLGCLGFYFYMDENVTVTSNCGPTNSPLCHVEWGATAATAAAAGKMEFDPETVQKLNWLPLASLMVFIFFFSLGIGPLAWTMNAELFSPEAKTLGGPITFCANWLAAFMVTKFEPELEQVIHASGTYFLFSGVCILGTAFSAFFVPETRGKSPEQIKDMFK